MPLLASPGRARSIALRLALTAVPLSCFLPRDAGAQPVEAPAPSQAPPRPPAQKVEPESSEQRATSLDPAPAEPKSDETRVKFEADPVRDGAIVAIGMGFAGMLQMIIRTGEVRPQQAAGYDTNRLLALDRGAVSQTLDPKAKGYSNLGLYAAVGYAVLDPIFSGVRDKHVQTALVDAIIYAESLTITWGVTNLAKLAVRRPRPIAYIEANKHKDDAAFLSASTDSSLSFFSGHTSICAATTATASYLAFTRSPGTARPWITLIVGTLVTGFVGYERVRSGDHFPSDVIAGALAGAGIGTLVPHFHRAESLKQRRVWVGFAPAPAGQGGNLTVSGYL